MPGFLSLGMPARDLLAFLFKYWIVNLPPKLNALMSETSEKRRCEGGGSGLTGGLDDLVLVGVGGVVILTSIVHSSLKHIRISFILNNNSIFSDNYLLET